MGKQALGRLLVLLAIAAVVPACGGGGGGKRVPGTVTVALTSATNHTTEDGVTKATFTVVLGKKPKKDVTIHVHSSSASEGDVDKSDLTFTSINWNVAQIVTVTGINEDVDDGNAPYTIILDPCVSLDLAYNGVDPDDVPLINEDNDAAGFDFQNILGLSTTESGGTATFTVRLTSEPTGDVTLNLASDDTGIGTVSPATLLFTIAAGADNWNSPHTVTLTGVNDVPPLPPGPHTWHVTFTAATSTDLLYNGTTPASITVSNSDNDEAGITATPNTGLVTNESGSTDSFTVVLNALPAGDVTITLTTSDVTAGLISTLGSPTPANTQTLTFTTLNWNATQTVTLHGQNDLLPRKNAAVPYTITLDISSIADAAYNALLDVPVSAINGDDDVPGTTVTPPLALVTSEASGPNHTATFTVQLDTIPNGAVTLTITSSDTNEGTVDIATLNYAAGDAAALNPTVITITGVQDLVIDPDTQYTIKVQVDAATADNEYLIPPIGDKTFTMTNQDDDAPGFTLSGNATSLSTSEPATPDSFTVALTSIPANPVTVNFVVTTNPGEASVTASVSFLADITALTPQPVTVTGQDDLIPDGPVAFEITGTATSIDTNYNGRTLTANGVNSDDEVPPIPGSGPWSTFPGASGIPAGAGGAWNDKASQEPCVIKDGVDPANPFVMWFEGSNLTGAKHEQIGRAKSADGKTWLISPAPIFTHSGTVGKFDRNGVGDPSVMIDGGTYKMWYAGKETGSKNKIGYATSPDGITWTRQNGGNPVVSTTGGAFDSVAVYGPSVIKDGATFHMYYTGVDGAGVTRIGHATSTDGIAWSKTPGAVLTTGTAGAWDATGVKMCGVLLDGTTIRMLYVGLNIGGGTQRIGLATAPLATPAVWTKFAGNPVLSPGAPAAFDERNLWSPWLIKDPDDLKFKMWYGGENNAGVIRIGYAEIP